MTTRSYSFLFAASALLLAVGCGDGRGEPCDPSQPGVCGTGQRCVVTDGEGFCEDVASCDPTDPEACAAGFICRPAAGGGAFCEPETTVGRIPGCIDSEGLDVFAVESNRALSVSWNVNAELDAAGGYNVRWGTTSGDYSSGQSLSPELREVVVSPLDNGVTYYVVIDTLDADGETTFTSCEVAALPHALAFGTELMASPLPGTNQVYPALASNLEGDRLYLAWEEEGDIAFARSDDFGDSWRALTLVGPPGGRPALAVRNAIHDPSTGDELVPETVLLAWEAAGEIVLSRYRPGDDTFEDTYAIATGSEPAIALGPNKVHIAYNEGGTIYHTASDDQGASFLQPLAVSAGTTAAGRPSIDVDQLSGDVYIGWHAQAGGGDRDIYVSTSLDEGLDFGGAVRVDDDAGGGNQLNVSVAIDERSGRAYATWEDARTGREVYFAWSDDQGAGWSTNINVGAGLGGDQFNPRAVVDVARNVYVVFMDTTNGQRPIFSRFSSKGTFDPPLAPSSMAGAEGVVGNNPSVATDAYGAVYVAWEENRGGAANQVFFNRAE